MLTLQRIAYGVGISISVSVFVLFLYTILPELIINNGWTNMDGNQLTDEELLKEFHATPAYIAFLERYPDAQEDLNSHRSGGDLQVAVGNNEKENYLKLVLYFNSYDDRINVNVDCQTLHNDANLHANGIFSIDFIKQTNCLDLEPTDSD